MTTYLDSFSLLSANFYEMKHKQSHPLTLLPPPSPFSLFLLHLPLLSLRATWHFAPHPGLVLSLWMAPSMLCPTVIEHYEVFHASLH